MGDFLKTAIKQTRFFDRIYHFSTRVQIFREGLIFVSQFIIDINNIDHQLDATITVY